MIYPQLAGCSGSVIELVILEAGNDMASDW